MAGATRTEDGEPGAVVGLQLEVDPLSAAGERADQLVDQALAFEAPHATDDGQARVQVEGEGVLVCFDDESLKSHPRFFGGTGRGT